MATIAGLAIALTPVLVLTGCSQSGPAAAVTPNSEVEVATPTREKIALRGVEFNHDGQLLPKSKPVLDAAAALVKSQPDAKIYVDAYCNPAGGADLNQRLSSERADAVKAYLERDGISADRMVARGFGATDFVASNRSASGRRQNRRIELVLLRND